MTRWRAVSSSLLLLLAAAAVAQEADELAADRPAGPVELVVPVGGPVVVDGDPGDEAWAEAATFEIGSGETVHARAALLRSGRDLLVRVRSEVSGWAFGLRLVFFDPLSGGRVVALLTPVNPPLPPLSLTRERPDSPVEWLPVGASDVRLRLREDETFDLEVRLPLDRLEIGRHDRGYEFAAEVWDLHLDRVRAAFPVTEEGPVIGRQRARLLPATDWGIDEPIPETAPEPQPALALLERIAAEMRGQAIGGGPPPAVIDAHLGTTDGRRDDEPLAALETRLRELIGRYPDYVSLRANLVRVLAGRNRQEEALEELRALKRAFPVLIGNLRQIMVEVELLEDCGRYADAIELLDAEPELLEQVPAVGGLRAMLSDLVEQVELAERMREQDAARDDLPRVRIVTDKGAFTVELFEDDAPNAVANFVSLCESGFYVGTRFHWVERGGRVVGGDPNSRDDDPDDDGFGDPGYLIESEPGRRMHLPFTLAFVDKRRQRRTEGSIFTVHLSAIPQLNGLNTVLGRVIDGFDVVRALEYGDAVTATEVVRKRDHAYEPVKRPLPTW